MTDKKNSFNEVKMKKEPSKMLVPLGPSQPKACSLCCLLQLYHLNHAQTYFFFQIHDFLFNIQCWNTLSNRDEYAKTDYLHNFMIISLAYGHISSIYLLPRFLDSSLAFWPAEITTSRGRGANEDQCSCFVTAISG